MNNNIYITIVLTVLGSIGLGILISIVEDCNYFTLIICVFGIFSIQFALAALVSSMLQDLGKPDSGISYKEIRRKQFLDELARLNKEFDEEKEKLEQLNLINNKL